MPRTRQVRHSTFTNEQLNTLPFPARWLFVGLWTIADRDGRLEDRPLRIKTEILGYDTENVDELLGTLATAGFITRYAKSSRPDGERKIIQINNFVKHQKPHPKEPSFDLPAMKNHGSAPAQPRPGREKGSARRALTLTFLHSNTLTPNPSAAADGGGSAISFLDDPEFRTAWTKWVEHRAQIRKPVDELQAQESFAELETLGVARAVAAIRHSIASGWQSINEPTGKRAPEKKPVDPNAPLEYAPGKPYPRHGPVNRKETPAEYAKRRADMAAM